MSVIVNKFLVEALGLALAASQIFIDQGVRQSFSVDTDKAEVIQIMSRGCETMRNQVYDLAPAFKLIEPVSFLDKQVAYAEKNNLSTVVFRGLRLEDLSVAYQIFCTGKVPDHAQALLEEVIFFYNATLQELPEYEWLKTHQLATFSSVYDSSGKHLRDIFRQSRRHVRPLAEIPEKMRLAILAAEDQNFYDKNVHKGIDQRGLARAGFSSLTGSAGKKSVGGSTITQQLVKNLLLTPENTYERKLREMVLAYRLEKIMTKDEILELYLNYVYFGRQAWGVDMAAQSWFRLRLDQLSTAQIAFLAGLPKGPRLLNPQVNPEKSRERTKYVLSQMATGKVVRPPSPDASSKQESLPVISPEERMLAEQELDSMTYAAFFLPMPTAGFHFFDEMVLSSRKDLGIDPLQNNSKIFATLNMELQSKVEDELREGLFEFELSHKKSLFPGPEGNLEEFIKKMGPMDTAETPAWRMALKSMVNPLEDVRWPLAIVLSAGEGKKAPTVGLVDGSILSLTTKVPAPLKLYDVVYVKVTATRVAELRFRPRVQGAAVVMENNGRIVSMVGGFSYATSQLNRAAHTIRSPGSTAKIATYLAALQKLIQPNTLVSDSPTTLQLSGDEAWRPQGASGHMVTLRNGLENSRNLVPVKLLSMMSDDPKNGLKMVLDVMSDCGLIKNPGYHYPAILGGGIDARVIDVATCYAAVANGGLRPTPHYIDKIETGNGQLVFQADHALKPLSKVDRESAFQMRRLFQGVVVRGTAKKLDDDLRDLVANGDSIENYMGGKTGTSQDGLDAWFVGFSHDLTIVVWVGYDNESAATREYLGDEITAAKVAVPIWGRILRTSTAYYPLRPLAEPPPQIQLIKVETQQNGQIVKRGVGEYHRLSQNGQPYNTRESWHSWPQTPPPSPTYYNYYPYTPIGDTRHERTPQW